MQELKSFPLDEVPEGSDVEITGVDQHTTEFLTYLDEHQLNIGKHITVIKINGFDGSFQIKTSNKKSVFISQIMAKNIFVK